MSTPALTPAEIRAELEASLARRGMAPPPPAPEAAATPEPDAEPEPWTMARLSAECHAAGVGASAHRLALLARRGRIAGAHKGAIGSTRPWLIAPDDARRWLRARVAAAGTVRRSADGAAAPRLCADCGRVPDGRDLTRGRCNACYNRWWRRETGRTTAAYTSPSEVERAAIRRTIRRAVTADPAVTNRVLAEVVAAETGITLAHRTIGKYRRALALPSAPMGPRRRERAA